MKEFHTKSKETNTFRFKSFAERINEIDVRQSVLYRIGHQNEELDDEDETLFAQTIRKWSVLNLTTEYCEFCKKCRGIVTLPQLIYKKDVLKDIFMDALDSSSILSLEPILDALVAFAKDIREDFYPYFESFFEKLIALLHTQNSDQLEWTLRCLAYLFKSLRPFLKRNIGVILAKVVSLLDNKTHPDYVVNFASECFSFVARDIKDYDKFLHLSTKYVCENSGSLSGCGKLFFELVRGVGGNFHSVANDFLETLFKSFASHKFNQEVLLQITLRMVSEILENIASTNIRILWKTLEEALSQLLKNVENLPSGALFNLIAIIKQCASWKNGKAITDTNQVINMLLQCLAIKEDKEILGELSVIATTVLYSESVKVQQLDASRLICKMLAVQTTDIYENFVYNMSKHAQFEVQILPSFLSYVETDPDTRKLDLLVQIIKKRLGAKPQTNWRKIPVKFKKSKTIAWIEKNIVGFNVNKFAQSQLEIYLVSVILYPHFLGNNTELVFKTLKEQISAVDFESETLETTSFLALIALEALVNLDCDIETDFLNQTLGNLLKSPFIDMNILQTLVVVSDYAERTEKKIFTKQNFLAMQSRVTELLSSSIYQERMLACKLLGYFSELKEVQTVYKIFYEAITIEPTVHTYREQLVLMQKLLPTGQVFNNITMDEVKLDCLKFAIGHLYQNFKLMWDSTMKLIAELANKIPADDFWTVYYRKLVETNEKINGECPISSHSIPNFKFKSLCSLVEELRPISNKVDFHHYRSLLWKNMSSFGVVTEVKNRDVVSLFLAFVENEFRRADETNAATWNVASQDNSIDCEERSVSKLSYSSKRQHHLVVSTLSSMLEVFAKLANPKQLYREFDMRAFYHEALKGSDEHLQKLSLDCLLRYKSKSWLPYKEHLYALIDDKTFKDELINFKLDVESTTIDPDHRSELMPILLRILYGKMRSKTANKFISSQMRRSIVMRFLAGCKTEEIYGFLQMAFEGYKDILKEDLEAIPKRIKSEFNLQQVFSAKKLRSALNLMELLRKQFGGLMEADFLVYTLKVVVLAGAVCRSIFDNKERVDIKFLAVFRNLRAQSLGSLTNFFDHFQNFNWKAEQVDSIFEVFIWPILFKLPEECLHSPTPLLKLFIVWSNNENLYKWLARSGLDGCTPLNIIVSMLTSEKPTATIRNTIMDMLERILRIEEANLNRDVHNTILAPYIDQILGRLVKLLHAKGRRKAFGKRELFILSKITGMQLDGPVCDSVLNLILPIVTGRVRISAAEESTIQLVTTLKNLMLKADNPDKHIRSIMPLFEKVTDISTRKELCQLLHDLKKHVKIKSECVKDVADLAEKLNAWDRKWVEQPDYDKRLSALRFVRAKLESSEISMELGLLVIYNCFYFLNHDKDLGLRDNASQCLRLLVPGLLGHFAHNSSEVNYIIEDVMFPLIRRTLRDKNDTIRNEGILLLGEMVRQRPESHTVLRDLQPLSCAEDLEVDFFENVTHLQLHRHGRALLKFCGYVKEGNKPISAKALTLFVLPLATRYLLTEKFATKHTIIDAAIEAVGMACRILPWQQYYAVLRYYLQKMRHCREYQKQCIRVVISILDGFNFDLGGINPQITNTDEVNGDEKLEIVEDKSEEQLDDDLDYELDELPSDEQNNETEQGNVPKKKTKQEMPKVVQTLSPTVAKQIIHTIAVQLIPSLNNSITELSSYESKHKINRRRVNFEREEQESLRVPIALAIAKLLKKLPKSTMDSKINGVFLKVCTFLRSPVKSVRMLTRDILKKIMETVGTEYLPLLLSQMTVLLTRGFQVHVLTVTLHSVLDCLKADLRPCDVKDALQYILNVTLNDIFGNASEEKEVDAIGVATPEAKPSAKSYLALQITAQNLPANCLLDLLIPFKQHLYSAQSKKVLTKIQDCFQKITVGLVENANISPEELTEIIYGIMSESIPDLLPSETKLTEKEKIIKARSQEDCFIIPKEPKSRSGAIQKAAIHNVRANSYILSEFGLELLQIILRRKKLNSAVYLDPLVPFLKKALQSNHVKMTTLTLKCFISIWIDGIELKGLVNSMEEIMKEIFAILHKNFSFGVSRKDENFLLIKSAMKAVRCVIANCDYHSLSAEQTTQLLYYISQDLNDSERQPVAFSLLKSLIDKQMYSKELQEIMQKLCEISITSECDYSRDEARLVLLSFVAMFHKEKKTDAILKFFIAQLKYELVTGRLSAVNFIESSVKKYPVEVLNRKAELIFLGLGTRLVNEDVPECRILIAGCLELLISRLDKVNRQKLFEMTVVFFQGNKPVIREMAACLCSRFAVVEKEQFLSKAVDLLPILQIQLGSRPSAAHASFMPSSSYDKMESKDCGEEIKQLSDQRAVDHSLIQVQNCILKIFINCPATLLESSLTPVIDNIASESQRLLAYDHEWVRMNAVKILNSILSTISVCQQNVTFRQFLMSDPESSLRSLTLDLCAQLIPGTTDEEFAKEISICLMYLAHIVQTLQHGDNIEAMKVNIRWLLRRVQYAIHGEVSKAPKSTVQRHCLFDWLEGIVALLDTDELLGHCVTIISPLIREVSDSDALVEDKLKQKAIKIMNKIRKKIGDEQFDSIRSTAQTKLRMRRAARKKELAQEKILDPVRSAKRKTSLKERKKNAKRQKVEVSRGKVGGLQKKRKRKLLDDVF